MNTNLNTIYVTDDPSQKSQNSHYFNKLLGSTVTLLAVIAYLTSDSTLKVVEGHKKSLKVQFQQKAMAYETFHQL
jgi:hypothetical protein